MKTIFEKIKEVREFLSISKELVASKLEWTLDRYTRFEEGKSRTQLVDDVLLEKIAVAMSCTSSYIKEWERFVGNEEEEEKEYKIRDIFEPFNALKFLFDGKYQEFEITIRFQKR